MVAVGCILAGDGSGGAPAAVTCCTLTDDDNDDEVADEGIELSEFGVTISQLLYDDADDAVVAAADAAVTAI